MSELDEFKKVVSPIAYGLALKTETGTTEYQKLYAEEDIVKYFNNKPQLTITKSIADCYINITNQSLIHTLNGLINIWIEVENGIKRY